MSKDKRYTKIFSYKGEDIECYGIYSYSEDTLFRMKVECDFCYKTQCRCFKSIEKAIAFEGIICSNRCFVLSYQGEDEALDEIIAGFELDIPLESVSDEIIDEIVSQMGDECFDDFECPMGEMCPV